MNNFTIKKCTLNDLKTIKNISEKTFFDTFTEGNSEEDMKKYLEENFSKDKLESEIKGDSLFYIVLDNEDNSAVGYMKVNFDKSHTEPGYNNSLEVQRIYILSEYKGHGIGKTLINKSIEIAKENKLDYVWLGVWEHNLNAIRFYEKMGFVKFDTHIFVLGDEKQTDYLMKFEL